MSRCRGESRTQGVHISQANVQLCKDVIETCSAGRFAISSIRRISERIASASIVASKTDCGLSPVFGRDSACRAYRGRGIDDQQAVS